MKNWVITGAGRGIGLELTQQVLASGDHATAILRNPAKSDGLKKLSTEFPSTLRTLQADVTDGGALARAAQAMGGQAVDVLINNAGVYLKSDGEFPELDLDAVEQTFSVNAVGPMRTTQAFLPLLKKSAHPVIANITSLMGSITDNGSGGSYAYRMSKTALNMFAKCLSLEFPNAIVLSLHPGWVKTDMGGAGAPIERRESAAGLLRVIRDASQKDTGGFMDFRGKHLEW